MTLHITSDARSESRMKQGSDGLTSQPCADAGDPCPALAPDATPSAEEWAAIRTNYDFYVVGPIARSTAKRVYHPDRWNRARDSYTDMSCVLYRGDQAAATRLVEQLKSSRALFSQERQEASDRHSKRMVDLIARAAGAE